MTVNIPEDCVGFRFFEAENEEAANALSTNDVPAYYLATKEEIRSIENRISHLEERVKLDSFRTNDLRRLAHIALEGAIELKKGGCTFILTDQEICYSVHMRDTIIDRETRNVLLPPFFG